MWHMLALGLGLLGVATATATAENCCPDDQGFGNNGIGPWRFNMEEKGDFKGEEGDFKITRAIFTAIPTIQAPWDAYFTVEADDIQWVLTVQFIKQ
jgi:hypothetical protein